MREKSRHILLGMLSGSLITVGAALLFGLLLSWLFLHHVFIMRITFHPEVLLLLVCPALFLVAGATLALRTLQNASSAWRTAGGILLLLVPLVALSTLLLAGIFLGSLGMDIHWKESRFLAYVVLACVVSVLVACGIAAVRLLRRPA